MPATTIDLIGRSYHMGFSIRRIANDLGLSRYLVNWAVDKYSKRQRVRTQREQERIARLTQAVEQA